MATAKISSFQESAALPILSGMTRLVSEQTEAFGKRLVLLRLACGYASQKTFSEALGIERITLSQYEAGRSYPKPDVLGRIRQLTGATVDWLYFGDEGGLPVILAQRLREMSS